MEVGGVPRQHLGEHVKPSVLLFINILAIAIGKSVSSNRLATSLISNSVRFQSNDSRAVKTII